LLLHRRIHLRRPDERLQPRERAMQSDLTPVDLASTEATSSVHQPEVLLVTVTRVAESGGQGLFGLAIHAVGHLFGEVAVFVAHRDDVAEPVVVEVVTALRPAVVGRTVAALDLGEAFASSEYPV